MKEFLEEFHQKNEQELGRMATVSFKRWRDIFGGIFGLVQDHPLGFLWPSSGLFGIFKQFYWIALDVSTLTSNLYGVLGFLNVFLGILAGFFDDCCRFFHFNKQLFPDLNDLFEIGEDPDGILWSFLRPFPLY